MFLLSKFLLNIPIQKNLLYKNIWKIYIKFAQKFKTFFKIFEKLFNF